MNQDQFTRLIDCKIWTAEECSTSHSTEFDKLIADHVDELKAIKDRTTDNFDAVVFPPFPCDLPR